MNRLLLVVAVLALGVSGSRGATIAMSPQGPVATLTAAPDAARQLREKGEAGPIVVQIADGVYPLAETLVLEPQDHGVTFEAAAGARPVFVGGKKISGFVAAADGVWTAQVPEVKAGQWYFEGLWVNGRRAVRARTPNEGYFSARGIGASPIAGIPLNGSADAMLLQVKPEELAPLKGLSAAELHDVNFVALHTWDVNRNRIAGFRAEDGTVQFTGGANHPYFVPEHSQRDYLENYRAALDAPGEFFLARDGTLSYIPRPGEKIESAEIWAPSNPEWIMVKGDPGGGKFVEDIHFRGLAFQYQAYALPETGAHFGQAEYELGAAVEADGAKNLSFDDCELGRTLTNAIWLRRGCHDVTLRHCYLHDLGGGGVKIGDPGMARDDANQTTHVSVDNCIIHGGGRHFLGAIGATIFHASDCTLRHCDIGDFYYSAVSIGWTWGYGPTAGGRNIVEFCDLHDVGQRVLSDMGAVYTLGAQPGTVIRNNRMHRVESSSYGGWGMYNDEGSAGIVWENNLIDHNKDAGYHMHYGRDDTVQNNIIAFGEEEHIRRSRPETFFAFRFDRNIVLMGKSALIIPGADNFKQNVAMNHNTYWNPAGPIPNFGGKTWPEWQSLGLDKDSIIADPMFFDPDHDDWTLKPESPALKQGFVPFDWKLAGVEGDEAWKSLAHEPLPTR